MTLNNLSLAKICQHFSYRFNITLFTNANSRSRGKSRRCLRTYLDGINSLWEVHCLLLLLLCCQRLLVFCQSPSNGTGLLWSEIERKVLLLGVEESELVSLGSVDDGVYFGNGFTNVVAICRGEENCQHNGLGDDTDTS